METKVYKFKIVLNWKLLSLLSKIDRFDASWVALERREKQSLTHLKDFATIQSVGSSTRIEGAKMSDDEVRAFIEKIEISKNEDRDAQEVAGYFNVLTIITEYEREISISINGIKNLHNQLLKHSEKDNWHRGEFKQHQNAVEANFPDGTKQIIFKTTEPGYATDIEMHDLVSWYNSEFEIHNLIKIAAFVYEFLSVHPFQDGNGRLSRLITTLLLLNSKYSWIQFISLEHEIETNKKHYYQHLRNCQANRPGEDISEWINFFLNSLLNVQRKLEKKLEMDTISAKMAPREKSIYLFILSNPGCKSGEISEKLNLPNPTTKRILKSLLNGGVIDKYGNGAGTNYAIN